MPANVFALLLVLLLVPHCLWAKVLSIPINVPTAVELEENDEIRLVGFPTGWVYSRIVLGINSVPSLQLSGNLVTNDCLHELHGYYDEVAFAYTGEYQIIYHGPTQNLPIHWWVDSSPVLSPCKSYSEMLRKDSVFAKLYDLADSLFSVQTSDYIDLGELNSEKFFEGTSSNFKIVNLPDWFYNRIIVQVEAVDGRELNGRAYANGTEAKIHGYSSQFALDQKTHLGPTFELAFPEYRKVKLKWWVEVQSPQKTQIETKVNQISSDSMEVEYTFEDEVYSKKSVKIVYDKRKFSDGRPPVIKKLSFNPHGFKKSKIFGVSGDVYEIEANVNPGDSVVIAIPVGNGYQPGKDSVILERYDETEDRWIEEPVDSIVDGYAYSNQPQRILDGFIHVWTRFTFGALCFTGFCDDVEDFVEEGFKKAGNGLKWVYKVIKNLVCGNIDELTELFRSPSSESERSNWDPDQGTVDIASLKNHGLDLISALDEKRKKSLTKISDPYLEGACQKVEECKSNPLLILVNGDCKKIEEICRWNRTKENLDILLADAILSQFNADDAPEGLTGPVYKFEYKDNQGVLTDLRDPNITYNYDDYFMVSSGLVEEAATFVEGLKNCADAINYSGKFIQRCIDWYNGAKNLSWEGVCKSIFGFFENISDWGEGVLGCNPVYLKNHWNLLSSHDVKVVAISEAMVRVSLLAWLKKADEFRHYTLLKYKSVHDGILAWIELAGAFIDYNNVAIKAYGSLALYEYIHYGTDEILKILNGSLNRHYGDNGGFSEGTGYSQYIWDDVPYVLAALKDAYKKQKEPEKFSISEKFLKSPDYMFEFSRPVGVRSGGTHYGMIPIEVDDGVTYNPDYRVWAKLKNDPKYLAMSEMYPLKPSDGKINPMVAFGFPDASLYNSNEKVLPNRGTLWGDFKDGIGMITAVNGDDTVALSMIAENENLWKRGQAHDQQDNLSITLTSSKKGFLIQDPGYSGFSARSSEDKFHRYNDHNVLVSSYEGVPIWGQYDNNKIPLYELWPRVYDFIGDFPGYGLDIVMSFWEIFSSFDYKYTVEGGEPATVLDRINEPQNGVIGFTATTRLNKPLLRTGMYDNNRTIMYFGGNFWVIDRPTNTDDMFWTWCANSPVERWEDLKISGLNLYGSRDGKLTPSRTPENDNDARILQNGSRSDFEYDNNNSAWYLRNYKYTALDNHTKTYVMTYSLGNETFDKDVAYCPKEACQCFVNMSKNMRVVVTPTGTPFKLCDVLPQNECSGEAESSGITMFVKAPSGEWTTRWVLDGELYVMEKNTKVPLSSATMTRTSYVYQKIDGSSPVNGKHTSPYLPALPILLLR